MFDLNAKSFLKTAKFGLGVTILVLATACSHEVVQQAPIDTAASTGVENVPDQNPAPVADAAIPEPSEGKASPLDQGLPNNYSSDSAKSGKHKSTSGRKSSSHIRHRRMIAKHSAKKSHKKGGKQIARRIEKKSRNVEPVAFNKPEKKAVATAATVGAIENNNQNPPVPPAPTPAAIGSIGDGNLGTVDTNQIGSDEGSSGLLGYWPYGLFALALGGGLFFATRNAGKSKGGKRSGLIFNS